VNGADDHTMARLLIEANRPADALRILSGMVAESPDDAVALRLLAQAHLLVSEGRQAAAAAVGAAEHAVALDGGNAFGWRMLSIAYGRLARHSEARDAARAAQRVSPDQWASHVAVANADSSAKHITHETHAAVAAALRLGPNEADVHFVAGRVAAVTGNVALATQEYQTTLGINPEHAAARNNLAVIEMRRGDTGRAAAGFIGMLAIDPNSVLAQYNLRVAALRALRIVNVVLVITVLIGFNIFGQLSTGADSLHAWAIGMAVVSAACIVAYVLWIRRKAGVYFGRFVRSIPRTDKLLTAWATILTISFVGIIVAVFLPSNLAGYLYEIIWQMLFVSFLVVLIVSRTRKPPVG
jgi:tetratricopeptide (TPR) repeat protein